MDVSVTADEIRAVDSAGSSLAIETAGWRADSGPSVAAALTQQRANPSEITATTAGRTTGLRLPGVHLSVVSLTTDEQWSIHPGSDEEIRLPADEYLVVIHAAIGTYLRFEGAARLQTAPDSLQVSFDGETVVSFGFKSTAHEPEGRVIVPETPTGVARALSTLAATPTETTAIRSWPSLRPRPPVVRFGEETRSVDVETPGGTDVTLRTPPETGRLLSAASLVYYLGADIDITPGVEPHLTAAGTRIPLVGPDGYDRRTNRLLRRVFWLDCLVRSADDYGEAVEESQRLPAIGIDAAELYDAPMSRRLREYVEAPVERIDETLPDWHLSVGLSATADSVRSVPRLLCNLPLFTVTDGSAEVPSRSPATSDDTTRGEAGPRNIPATFAGTQARFHGSLDGSGRGFEATHAALTHRDRYVEGDDGDTLEFVTVVNDGALSEDGAAEGDRAAALYRDRADRLDQNVSVRRNLTTEQLASQFEAGADLIHFVGHCDEAGLSCADGALDVGSIEESNARVFLLNACGSIGQGRGLIRRGSVAGGVTRRPVIDETAVRVGTTFAGLVCGGFAVARAVAFASQPTLSPDDYQVVGDGTHILTQHTGMGVAARIEPADDGYRLFRRYAPFGQVGAQMFDQFDPEPHLGGVRDPITVDRDTLTEWLSIVVVPVLFDGAFYTPDELREQLHNG